MEPLVLDTIEEELDYIREYYREVVRQWMKMTDPKPKWQVLVTALRDINEETLAMYMRSTFTVGKFTIQSCIYTTFSPSLPPSLPPSSQLLILK